MKRSFMMLFWMLPVLPCMGQEGPLAPVVESRAPQTWLGFKVGKPDASISTHLPELPKGMGFIVKSVDPGGPAEAAGVQELDLIWKMGDQMLVNEAQLAALLRLSKPGDEVKLSAFRRGQAIELKVKLGIAPALVAGGPRDLADSAILPVEAGPMRVINVAAKSATYANDEGRATVRKEGDVYKISIQTPASESIYEGELTAGEKLEKIPESWRQRVCALRRGLDRALENRAPVTRLPRPRVVPVPPADAPKS